MGERPAAPAGGRGRESEGAFCFMDESMAIAVALLGARRDWRM